ncbi:unnamed protein product [Mytilus coruscus]|uniref:B box-type domain-containing protein n=1 Tax=Mytilus coruscus TaxID=42192 RepID=A0A6J8AG47_MYTCO|nr:unnamed protein product [Mytilus coruscus]
MSMSESTNTLCGSCPSSENNNTAKFWCFDCLKPICTECRETHLGKFHSIISISEVDKMDKSVITGPCKCIIKCFQNSFLHCKSHDEIYCPLCTTEKHITCTEVQSIEKAAKGCQHSASVLVTDLERKLADWQENYLRLIEEQELNLTDLNFQKFLIKTKVSHFRKDMNEYLNELEDNIGNQLDRYYEQCRTQMTKHIETIQQRSNTLSSLESGLHLTTKHASECCTFIAAKNIDRIQCEEESFFETFQEALNIFKLSYSKGETVDDLKEVLKTFGEVKLEVKERNIIDSRQYRGIQDAVRIRTAAYRLHDYDSTEFDLGEDGRISNSCWNSKREILMVGNERAVWTYNIINKSKERINLSDFPEDVFAVDDKTFLVAMGKNGVSLVNTATKREQHILKSFSDCVAYQDDVIYTVDKKILILSHIHGSIMKIKSIGFHANSICVDSKGDVYVSDNQHICKLDSVNYRKEVVLAEKGNETCDIGGITIDKDNRLYYSDKTNGAIMRLDLNSKTAKVIIENLQNPLSIACDKTNNQILVITDRGSNIEIWQL